MILVQRAFGGQRLHRGQPPPAEEAGLFVRKVRTILCYLGTCDGNMEQGSLRCDVNISVRHPGDALGTRAAIKNINSVRFVHQAIEYETRRQIKEIEGGGDVAPVPLQRLNRCPGA